MSQAPRNAVMVFLIALVVEVLLRGRSPMHLTIPAVVGALAGALTYARDRWRVHPSGAPEA
jgi:hypothetical protein